MIVSLIFTAAFVAAAPIDIAVVPIAGSAEATKLLQDLLGNVEGVRVIALGDAAKVLGAEAAAKLGACTDDRCVIDAIQPVRSDGIIAGSVGTEEGRELLRLRLIVSSTTAAIQPARTTHELQGGGLASAVGAAIVELLPTFAAKSFGLLEVTNAPPETELAIDGVVFGVLAKDATTLRLPAGRHRVAARAPGHESFSAEAEVRLGQKARVVLEMTKRRSNSPYIVAGVGGAALLAAGVLGALASTTASDWNDACTGGHCAPGFTKRRYEEDRSNVDRYRVSANALFVVSAVAVAAGAVWYLLDPGVDEDAP